MRNTISVTLLFIGVSSTAWAQEAQTVAKPAETAPTPAEPPTAPPANSANSANSANPSPQPVADTPVEAETPSAPEAPPEQPLPAAPSPAPAYAEASTGNAPTQAAPSAASTPSSPYKDPATGPGLTFVAGATTGVGLGYRQFYGRFGLQLTAFGVGSDDFGFFNGGLQTMFTLVRKNLMRFYVMAGAAAYHTRGEDTPDGDDFFEPHTTLAVGSGIGIALNTDEGFFLGAEVPLTLFLPVQDSGADDGWLLIPALNAFIGGYF